MWYGFLIQVFRRCINVTIEVLFASRKKVGHRVALPVYLLVGPKVTRIPGVSAPSSWDWWHLEKPNAVAVFDLWCLTQTEAY